MLLKRWGRVLSGVVVFLATAASLLFGALLGRSTPGAWTPQGNLNQARSGHSATLLPNGQVLIAGGRDASGHALSGAELYDPSNDTFTPIASNLPNAVSGQTATLLKNGSVLLVGGTDDSGKPVDSVQLFDYRTATFTVSASMSTARSGHTQRSLMMVECWWPVETTARRPCPASKSTIPSAASFRLWRAT
jgi:hypothetical protein